MWKWVLCRLGLKNPNRNYEQKTIMDEGTSNYVNEAKSLEIMLKDCIVEEFNSGRMSRDDLKALEKVEKFKTAEQGLSRSRTEWRHHKEIQEEFIEKWKELEKMMEELTAGENKQLDTTDMEPQHTRRENAVTEVLKLKAYQPKSEIEDAAPIDKLMLPYSVKAQEVIAGAQTGDVGMKGMPICKDLVGAKFQMSTIGARSVQRGSAEVVLGSWNVQLGRCLMDQYSSGKTSRDCLKLLEVDKEFQSGGHRLYGEQTEPDIKFPEEIASASKEEKRLPGKMCQNDEECFF